MIIIGPWTHILETNYDNWFPVSEKWPIKPFSSIENVRPVFIVKSEFLGYNELYAAYTEGETELI